jgi:hypothetical protein
MKFYRRNSLYGLVVFAVESIGGCGGGGGGGGVGRCWGGSGGGGFASDFCIVYITTRL